MKILGHPVRVITEDLIYLEDSGEGRSLTNNAESVLRQLHFELGGLKNRRVFYKDTLNDIDEMVIKDGVFSHFRSCDLDIIKRIRHLLKRDGYG